MDEGIDRQAGENGEAGSGQLDARAEKGEMPAPRRFSMHGRREKRRPRGGSTCTGVGAASPIRSSSKLVQKRLLTSKRRYTTRACKGTMPVRSIPVFSRRRAERWKVFPFRACWTWVVVPGCCPSGY